MLLGIAAVAGALMSSGCGVSSASSDMVRVCGRVTCSGKPVTNGAIIFMPVENFHTNWGVGQIDHEGKYRLDRAHSRGNAETRSLSRLSEAAAANGRPGECQPQTAQTGGDAESASAPATVETSTKCEVPERFLNPQTSEMMVRIGPSLNRIDVDL